jgi:hypothetical protein
MMMYFAIGLAAIGTGAGLAFRWKVLLPIILLLPFAAIILSLFRRPDLEKAVIAVLVAEVILQCGYFLGLFIRSVATSVTRPHGDANSFKSRRVPETHDKDRRPIPPTGASGGGL